MTADFDLLVFDILGTLVDEPGGLHRAIGEIATEGIEELADLWLNHVTVKQEAIVDGREPFVPSDIIDREAAEIVAAACGVTDPAAIARLAQAERRLDPWPDTAASLERLAQRFPLVGLSNASRSALPHLNSAAGLRWHFLLSAEDARTYKPAPEVYKLAVDLAATAPDRLLMVAAHSWDLRGAQAVGMRTAYVQRPVGDPPRESDDFDYRAGNLADLATALGA
ncbi:haloacid dehalogenase type II [Glycomyces sp. NPDC046736]|uniref:haloacid dehalogenase type II n=1 Tax=Glycomyces sp. NPDC046736 TaxID=3155615 RepID=UPI00340B1506